MSVTMKYRRAEVTRIVNRAVNEACFAGAEEGAKYAERVLTGSTGRHEGAPAGSYPNFQTGELANSVRFVHPDKLGTPFHASWGTAVKHGAYMEKGAVVRPRNSKAIPVPVNVQAKQMLARIKGASLRTQKLVPFKKDGHAYLGEATPKGKLKKSGALFVLKKTVVIRARPWLVPSMNVGNDAIRAAFARTVAKEIKF